MEIGSRRVTTLHVGGIKGSRKSMMRIGGTGANAKCEAHNGCLLTVVVDVARGRRAVRQGVVLAEKKRRPLRPASPRGEKKQA